MQNIQYHIMNILAVILFSYSAAWSVTTTLSKSIGADSVVRVNEGSGVYRPDGLRHSVDMDAIIDKGFFAESDAPDIARDTPEERSSLDELELVGTVTGPWQIARALIQKRGESAPRVFALARMSSDVTNDVFGYKLVYIATRKVYLTKNGERFTIGIDDKKRDSAAPSSPNSSNSSSTHSVSKNISRAEIQQKVLGDMDNALKGLRAGPYRVNGKVVGYRLIQVRPYNILYKFGARSGDIVKRVNGHEIDSTEKLYQMWNSMKTDSQITVDLERGGRTVSFEFNITE